MYSEFQRVVDTTFKVKKPDTTMAQSKCAWLENVSITDELGAQKLWHPTNYWCEMIWQREKYCPRSHILPKIFFIQTS
jgi:hypothetical protein